MRLVVAAAIAASLRQSKAAARRPYISGPATTAAAKAMSATAKRIA